MCSPANNNNGESCRQHRSLAARDYILALCVYTFLYLGPYIKAFCYIFVIMIFHLCFLIRKKNHLGPRNHLTSCIYLENLVQINKDPSPHAFLYVSNFHSHHHHIDQQHPLHHGHYLHEEDQAWHCFHFRRSTFYIIFKMHHPHLSTLEK